EAAHRAQIHVRLGDGELVEREARVRGAYPPLPRHVGDRAARDLLVGVVPVDLQVERVEEAGAGAVAGQYAEERQVRHERTDLVEIEILVGEPEGAEDEPAGGIVERGDLAVDPGGRVRQMEVGDREGRPVSALRAGRDYASAGEIGEVGRDPA